jgi:hypothetical protein
MAKSCSTCVFSLLQDHGYSNWTVEGTVISCYYDLNPGFPTDRFYDLAVELKYAEQCEKYKEGAPARFDVDGENTIEEITEDETLRDMLLVERSIK